MLPLKVYHSLWFVLTRGQIQIEMMKVDSWISEAKEKCQTGRDVTSQHCTLDNLPYSCTYEVHHAVAVLGQKMSEVMCVWWLVMFEGTLRDISHFWVCEFIAWTTDICQTSRCEVKFGWMPLVVRSGIYILFYVGFCELLMNRTQLPYHSVVVTKFTIYGPWLPMKVPFRDHTQMCYGEPQILKEVMRKAGFVVDGPLCLAFFFWNDPGIQSNFAGKK